MSNKSRAAKHFYEELDQLLNRLRLEYDLTYFEAIGALETMKHDLLLEAEEEGDDDESRT